MPIHHQRRFSLGDEQVGMALAAARRVAELSLRSASEKSGIDFRVLNRIELGTRPCRVTELVALADTYQVKPDALLHDIIEDKRKRDRAEARKRKRASK